MDSYYSIQRLSDESMEAALKRLDHIERSRMPAKGSKAFTLLILLVLNEFLEKDKALAYLNDDPRSPLQQLRGRQYGYWNIHNVGEKKAVYVLDSRHLISEPRSDTKARLEARVVLADRSYKQCLRESQRIAKAYGEFCSAHSGQLNLEI